MKSDILVYVNSTFNEETKKTLLKAINVINLFELEGFEDDLSNILMSGDMVEPDQLQNDFVGILTTKLAFILITHTLSLQPQTRLNFYVEIAYALYILQDLYDFSMVDQILDSTYNTEEKICNILSLYCTYSPVDILMHLKDYDSSLLQRISDLSDQSKNKDLSKEVADNMLRKGNIEIQKLYYEYTNIYTLGLRLIKKGYKPLYPLSYYLPYIEDEVLSADEDSLNRGIPLIKNITVNVISLALLSDKGYNIYLMNRDEKDSLLNYILKHVYELVPTVTPALLENITENVKGFYDFLNTKATSDG